MGLLVQKIQKLHSIVTAVIEHKLLSQLDYNLFLNMHTTTTLLGTTPAFKAPNVQSLVKLLDENWVREQVLDAHTELIMLWVNSLTTNRLLILPSFFYTSLSNAFNSDHFMEEIQNLHESLLADPPQYICYATLKSGTVLLLRQ